MNPGILGMAFIAFGTLTNILCSGPLQMIEPTKALLVSSSENWGCVSRFEVRQDVTNALLGKEAKSVTLKDIKKAEDITERDELFLWFPANRIQKLEGDLVVVLGCKSEVPREQAFLNLNTVRLNRSDRGVWRLELNARGRGRLYVKSLYGRNPALKKGWSICAGGEPFERNYLTAYPLEGEWDGIAKVNLNERWQRVTLGANPFSFEMAESVDWCQQLFNLLDNQFGADGKRMRWDYRKVGSKVFSQAVQSFKDSRDRKFSVLLKTANTVVQSYGSDNFAPHFKQSLVLENYRGNAVEAEVWIYAEKTGQ